MENEKIPYESVSAYVIGTSCSDYLTFVKYPSYESASRAAKSVGDGWRVFAMTNPNVIHELSDII